MKRLISIVLVLFIWLSAGYMPGVAAQGDDEECTAEQLQAWWDITFPLFTQYDQLMAEYNPATVTLSSLETAATVQALRRQLESVEVPSCAVRPAPDLFASMLNLTADSIVSTMIGDTTTASTLMDTATEQHEMVADSFVGYTPIPNVEPTEEPAANAITYPAENATVPIEVNVQGTFDPADLGGNDLWLFVLATNNKYYAQVFDACANPRTITVREGRTTWRMTAFIGAPNDSGASFELFLGTLPPESTPDLYDQFPVWCANNWENAGITEAELYDVYGFTELAWTIVVRE
jgi:hypothetical protein